MATMYILVGAPATGKSTYAKENFKDAIIVSSDKVREIMYGSEEIQGSPAAVFSQVHFNCWQYLVQGIDVVVDATNISKKNRAKLRGGMPLDTEFKAIVFKTDLETAIKRNAERDRHVPEDVIKRMFKNFEMPTADEGFAEIIEV